MRYLAQVTPGQLLREARKRHGLTQRQLAARARTSQAAVSRVERDLVSPSVATLASWLDLMGEELTLATEPIEYGHDRTLHEQQLALEPEARIDRMISFANLAVRTRGAAARAR
jgi:transcriptional regulator with XRE-family HTH domain